MDVQFVLALYIAGAAVLADFLEEKVPNLLIYTGLVSGLLYQAVWGKNPGFFRFFQGVLLPFILLFPLFYFHMLGAGDIKVFCALGSLFGGGEILKLIVCSFLFGAVLSLAFLISSGNFKERISYFLNYLSRFYKTKQVYAYIQKGVRAENFHFTVPIYLSVLLYAGGFY